MKFPARFRDSVRLSECRAMRAIVLTVIVVCPCLWAAEQVVLESGFRLRTDRHERVNGVVRLYMKDGVTEIPESAVATIEQEEYVPPPPPPAPVAPSVNVPPTNAAVDPKALVTRMADQHGLPREFLHLVARAESNYQVDAVSPKGALGIMQLMPDTAAALKADPLNPEQNVDAGARYLRELLIKYQGHDDQLRRALAAYNAGPGAVDRYNGVPPYRETQSYVNRILDAYRRVAPKH